MNIDMEGTTLKEILRSVPNFTRFLKVREIDAIIEDISRLDGVDKSIIGRSIEGEELAMLEIGKGSKTALVLGVPHSDEPLGSLLVALLARWLAIHKEQECFGWKWLLVPILERRGMRLNEGWFNMPHDLDIMARSYFREPTEDQYEWSFPIEYEEYHWNRPRPETIAVKSVIEKERPDLLFGLHHCGFSNAYFYFSRDMPSAYPRLLKLAKSLRIPLATQSPDVPFGKVLHPGFYQMYGLKDYIDYYKSKDPSALVSLKRGACSDEFYSSVVKGFSFNCEVPIYLTPAMRDTKRSNKSLKHILEAKYERNLNVLRYSIRMMGKMDEFKEMADQVLFDSAKKHVQNARTSLEHDKKMLSNLEERYATNAELYENEVMADIFDLFFLGQIWRVSESICIQGGGVKPCRLMEKTNLDIKTLAKSVQSRGGFYHLPIQKSIQMQLGSLLIMADELLKGA